MIARYASFRLRSTRAFASEARRFESEAHVESKARRKWLRKRDARSFESEAHVHSKARCMCVKKRDSRTFESEAHVDSKAKRTIIRKRDPRASASEAHYCYERGAHCLDWIIQLCERYAVL